MYAWSISGNGRYYENPAAPLSAVQFHLQDPPPSAAPPPAVPALWTGACVTPALFRLNTEQKINHEKQQLRESQNQLQLQALGKRLDEKTTETALKARDSGRLSKNKDSLLKGKDSLVMSEDNSDDSDDDLVNFGSDPDPKTSPPRDADGDPAPRPFPRFRVDAGRCACRRSFFRHF